MTERTLHRPEAEAPLAPWQRAIELPRRIGHTLGFRLAGPWLDAAPRDMVTVVGVPKAERLEVALSRRLGER